MENTTLRNKPFRGWVLLLAIYAWIKPIFNFIGFVAGLIEMTSFPIIGSVTMTYALTVYEFTNMVISSWVLILFMKRKKKFIRWFLISLVWAAISGAPIDILRIYSHDTIVGNLIGGVLVIVLALYVLRSKRVKDTFVN